MFLNFRISNNAIGYIVDGVMDTKAIHYLRDEILKKLEDHEKISIYLEDAGVERFSLDSIIVTTIFPHKHRNRFDKVAMVTDRKWIHVLSSVNGLLVDATIKNFIIEDRMKAIDWIENG